MREIYWFRNDLRLQDNPGLLAHAQADELLCVFFWPRPRPWCNVSGIGAHRERFLVESLQALRDALRERGQDLLVLQGAPELLLPDLVGQHRIARIGVARAGGVDEERQLEGVRARVGIPLALHPANTLFRHEQLPFPPGGMPRQFTPFRERVEALDVDAVQPAPDALPPPPRAARFAALARPVASPHPGFAARGGTVAGERRLHDWMWRERAAVYYKDTRNALDGLHASARLSPWLANGSLSARQVALELLRFEREETRNESTGWFRQELL
nr:deoxyribodipyrimidine photo-lyase [Pseudomonadales bacterium]